MIKHESRLRQNEIQTEQFVDKKIEMQWKKQWHLYTYLLPEFLNSSWIQILVLFREVVFTIIFLAEVGVCSG